MFPESCVDGAAMAPALRAAAPAMHQKTIKKSVTLDGVGLHTGRPCRVTVHPAAPGSGITFHLREHDVSIPAAPESVVNSHYATTLGRNGARVLTVEHLMAAVAGLGIDNADVEVEGPEIPAADGSAKPFVALLTSARRVEQSAQRRPLVIPHAVRVGDDARWIEIVPSSAFRVSYTLDNDHPAIGTQVLSCAPTERMFAEEFAPARTYGFLKDLGWLRKNGLARGASLENAIGVGKRSVLNGLRYRDEFVRHKILDLIGDLALLGRPIVGHVMARNAGHALNFDLVVAIQRALGLERRPVGAVAGARGALELVHAGTLVPAPG